MCLQHKHPILGRDLSIAAQYVLNEFSLLLVSILLGCVLKSEVLGHMRLDQQFDIVWVYLHTILKNSVQQQSLAISFGVWPHESAAELLWMLQQVVPQKWSA